MQLSLSPTEIESVGDIYIVLSIKLLGTPNLIQDNLRFLWQLFLASVWILAADWMARELAESYN